jgi:hypothetical protein
MNPRGVGLSSSTVNVVWGAGNLGIAYLLLVHVGEFNIHSLSHVGVAAAGAFLISLQMAHHFGQFHGGNLKKESSKN